MTPGHNESYGSGYGHGNAWIESSPYPQHSHQQHAISPAHEYQGFEYGQQPLPMEPASYTMPRPPPYAAAQHHHHQQLPPPLVMPQNNVWPSMLATQSNYPQPILPANAMHTPVSAGPSTSAEVTPTSAKSTSRRKLTDDERRQMCLEAEQNPNMKQTQIGAKFNVERSTVSKILRQKDKYMKPPPKEEVVNSAAAVAATAAGTGSNSPARKSKVKLPDVEKTLVNWVRNQQKRGITITDEELQKHALMFSAGRADQQTISSSSWLLEFKQKHVDSGKDYTGVDIADVQSETSPESSTGLVSPPMPSVVEERDPGVLSKLDITDALLDFDARDDLNEFSAGVDDSAILTPVTADLASSTSGLAVILPDHDSLNFSFSRQRSQTSPNLQGAVDLRRTPRSHQPIILPKRLSSSQSIDTTIRGDSIDPRQMMKRHKSVPDIHNEELVHYASMQPPPLPRSAEMSPVSNPASPAGQDDNVRALYQIKQLLEQRPDVAEPDDYVMIGKLLEKLKLLRSPTGTPVILTGIDSPRISKKRTIVGISN